MKISINKLQKTVNAVKNLASKIEKDDLETATYLMFLAHYARPIDPLIKSKLDEYNKRLNLSPSEIKSNSNQASPRFPSIVKLV